MTAEQLAARGRLTSFSTNSNANLPSAPEGDIVSHQKHLAQKPNLEDMQTLCANIGTAVIACQATEKLINLSLLLLSSEKPIRTVEMLEQLEEQHRRTPGSIRLSLLSDVRETIAPFLDKLVHKKSDAHPAVPQMIPKLGE